MTTTPKATVREAVGVFDGADDLEAAIDDLMSHGFDRAALSLLAGEAAVAEKLGHAYQRTRELEDNPAAAREAYVSTESYGDAEGGLIGVPLYIGAVTAAGAVIATGGTLGLAILAAVAAGGAGGLLGTVLAAWLDAAHARYIEEQLEKGGLLLWVTVHDPAQQKLAVEVLARHSGRDVHIHDLPVG